MADRMALAVAILMKDPADAKTRLRPALASDAREKLALALFAHTLSFFTQRFESDKLKHVGVVTDSERIAEMARAGGAEVIPDARCGGINGAARQAAQWARAREAASLLLMHADIPTLARKEVAELIAAGERHAVALARSADGGTNALMVSPPEAIPFCFGKGSAAAHLWAAKAAGASAVAMDFPFLSQDLDTPGDLRALLGLVDYDLSGSPICREEEAAAG